MAKLVPLFTRIERICFDGDNADDVLAVLRKDYPDTLLKSARAYIRSGFLLLLKHMPTFGEVTFKDPPNGEKINTLHIFMDVNFFGRQVQVIFDIMPIRFRRIDPGQVICQKIALNE
jgi:hypothetical protein